MVPEKFHCFELQQTCTPVQLACKHEQQGQQGESHRRIGRKDIPLPVRPAQKSEQSACHRDLNLGLPESHAGVEHRDLNQRLGRTLVVDTGRKHIHRTCLLPCRFTLAALENSDKHEAQRAQALVRRYGGRRFTGQTLHLLQGVDKGNVLALCPCSLPKHKVTQLQSWGDFTSGTGCIGNCLSQVWCSGIVADVACVMLIQACIVCRFVRAS